MLFDVLPRAPQVSTVCSVNSLTDSNLPSCVFQRAPTSLLLVLQCSHMHACMPDLLRAASSPYYVCTSMYYVILPLLVLATQLSDDVGDRRSTCKIEYDTSLPPTGHPSPPRIIDPDPWTELHVRIRLVHHLYCTLTLCVCYFWRLRHLICEIASSRRGAQQQQHREGSAKGRAAAVRTSPLYPAIRLRLFLGVTSSKGGEESGEIRKS